MACPARRAKLQSPSMSVDVRILSLADLAVLANIADDVFDQSPDAHWTAAFLASPNHHLAVAVQRELVVGMATAVHYFHPDKPPELWINEVGVAPSYRGRGLGHRLIAALLEVGTRLGCRQAWTLTDADNTASRRLFASLGGREAPPGTVMIDLDLA